MLKAVEKKQLLAAGLPVDFNDDSVSEPEELYEPRPVVTRPVPTLVNRPMEIIRNRDSDSSEDSDEVRRDFEACLNPERLSLCRMNSDRRAVVDNIDNLKYLVTPPSTTDLILASNMSIEQVRYFIFVVNFSIHSRRG
jgi:hypothetical protein